MNIKQKIIANGVKNLRAFGYPKVTEENILTDKIYSAFFESLLNDNFGNGEEIDKALREIQADILASRGA